MTHLRSNSSNPPSNSSSSTSVPNPNEGAELVERRCHNKIDMHKWNLRFSGDDSGLGVVDFIRRVGRITIAQHSSYER